MPTSDPIRTVLFDLDGTLLDSIALILAGFHEMMTVHKGAVPPDIVWTRGIGTPLVTQIAELADDAEQAEAMRVTYAHYNVSNHERLARAYPGVVDVVRTLQRSGVALGIVTSKKRRGAFRGLDTMGITDAFGAIVGVDDVSHAKPHPRPVLQAIELLDADPSTTVFIGDSDHDMASGRAAGVRTGAVLWGPFDRDTLARHEPTWWFEDPSQLLPVLLPGDGPVPSEG